MDDNDDSEVVSVLMKMSRDDGRQTGMPMGVWLNLWALPYPLPQPGYRRSTAKGGQEEKGSSENKENKRVKEKAEWGK